MDVEKCRTFVAAAENGTFTAAADKLFMTTANVTKHIASLEKELGFALFDRRPHGVRLTQKGEKCVVLARQIIQASEEMYAAGGSKILKICSIPCQQRIELPKLLAEFHDVYPEIQLELEEHHGLQLLKKLLNEDCEVGFLGNLYSQDTALESISITKEHICALLPADHRYASERQISLEQLKDEEFVFLSPESGMYQVYRELCLKCGFEPRVRMTVSREDTMLSYIENGIGISLCGQSSLEAYQTSNAVVVELSEDFYSRCVLARKKGKKLSKNGEIFWSFVERKFGNR